MTTAKRFNTKENTDPTTRPALIVEYAPPYAIYLPQRGLVLEVASGSGEHCVHFARAAGPELVFQPSDPDAEARASIDAWIAEAGLPNVRPALALDAAADSWPIGRADAVVCINMIHISPWASAVGLVRGAARVLPSGGFMYLYGPYRREGRHTAPSNEAFDRDFLALGLTVFP